MKMTKFKKGESTGPMMTAGQDMIIAEEFGIEADIFDCGKYYQCPNVLSKTPGSGKFSEFLGNLKRTLDKPVVFESDIDKELKENQ